MRDRIAGIAAVVVAAGAVAVLVAAAITGDGDVAGSADAVADRLRCVDCDHGSIADSPSVADRDLRRLIAARFAAGNTADAIVDDFVAGYGPGILLAPGSGTGLVLWLLPGLVLIGGAVAGWRLLRRPGPAAGAAPEVIARDRADLEAELAAGEISAAEAVRLRTVYRREADRPPPPAAITPASWAPIGAAALIAVLVAVLAARNPSESAAGAGLEGVMADVAVSGGPDLAGMSATDLAKVVDRNPDVVPLRLALARLYRDGGDPAAALGELTTVIDRFGPIPEAVAEAGWIIYLGGDAGRGEELLETALLAEPDLAPALWYLGNVRWFGLADATGAAAALDDLLALPDVPDDLRRAAEDLLVVIGAGP